jgi:hypothetical protein
MPFFDDEIQREDDAKHLRIPHGAFVSDGGSCVDAESAWYFPQPTDCRSSTVDAIRQLLFSLGCSLELSGRAEEGQNFPSAYHWPPYSPI